MSCKVDAQRIAGTSTDVINQFFDSYEALVAENNVRPENIWNMDETGISLDASRDTMVLADTRKSRAIKRSSGDREGCPLSRL